MISSNHSNYGKRWSNGQKKVQPAQNMNTNKTASMNSDALDDASLVQKMLENHELKAESLGAATINNQFNS